MEKKPFSTNVANRVCTPECTNSTYNSWHKFDVHSLIPLDVNASPYEKREGRGEREGWARGTHTTEYWFAFLHSVIVLTLLDRIARYVCTYNLCVQRQQIKIEPAKKREGRGRRSVGRMLLEENQSSSVRNRLSSEGDREYNKQRRSLRGRRQSPRRAHTRATTPFEIAVHRFTISKIYPLEGGWFCRESSRERKRHLNSYVPW